MSESFEIVNAKIESVSLGPEDHDIMTYWMYLDYGNGTSQGFGGYALDSYDKETKGRKGHPDSIMVIRRILEVVGVRAWSNLTGKYIRVRFEKDFGNIQAIGHIIEDNWFEPNQYFKK